MQIGGLILAAGNSKRMGDKNKLLLKFRSEPIIKQVCRVALNTNLKPLYVVTGFQKNLIEKVIPPKIDKIIYNMNWSSGMASSIYAGLSCMPNSVSGCMIILGDMPLIKIETINLLLSEFKKHLYEKIVFPMYKKNQANPVIFPNFFFPDILACDGDNGAKKVLMNFPDKSIGIPIESDEVILDCNTDDDYFLINTKMS